MTAKPITASDFSYDVMSDEAAEDFFSLMARSNVQAYRIDRMRETRRNFLAATAR